MKPTAKIKIVGRYGDGALGIITEHPKLPDSVKLRWTSPIQQVLHFKNGHKGCILKTANTDYQILEGCEKL